jgi:signal transduction histidine kinase
MVVDYEGLRGILDRLPTGIFFVTGEGEIPLHNAKAPGLLGVDALDLLERGMAAVPGTTGIPDSWKSLRGEEHGEQTLEFARGSFRFSATLVQGDHALFGEPCVLVLISDITERERLRELRQGVLKEILRRVKGPLTSVKTAMALLNSPAHADLPESVKEVVSLGDAEVRRLHGLLGDMSELLALESPAAGSGLYMENVEPGPLLRKCARAAGKTPPGRGREILLPEPSLPEPRLASEAPPLSDAAANGPAFVIADLDKLRLVVDHLLANALAYSDASRPVRISWRESGASTAELRIEDEGIGILPADFSGLFGKFFRGTHPDALAKEGSGLGLFISRSYAELMGGSLRLENRPDRGVAAILTLQIPARDLTGERGP